MDGLIPRNATEAVKPPQVRREEMQPFSLEQVKVLREAARGQRLEALYVLAVTTGLRQGELLGLKWEDVDLEARLLRVCRTLATTKGGPQLTTVFSEEQLIFVVRVAQQQCNRYSRLAA
jgi:integrase